MFKEIVFWVHHWSDRTFSFKTTRSPTFRFNAGEFAMIGMNIEGKNVVRAYSIVSPPWADYLEFLSIKIDDGELTSKLKDVKDGSEIIIMPKTTGTLRNEGLIKGRTLWMLATGTGLAPFMSLVRDLDTLEIWNDIRLIHSVRDRKDLAYYSELYAKFKDTDLQDLVQNKLFYMPIVTGEGDKRITEILDSELGIDPSTDKIMLCGNIEFNRQVAQWCLNNNMKEGSLREPGDFVLERAFVDK